MVNLTLTPSCICFWNSCLISTAVFASCCLPSQCQIQPPTCCTAVRSLGLWAAFLKSNWRESSPDPHLGSLCSPFSKATEGAWQETLPFCYCFCNCSFSPSVSARPCPGTPIVAFILRSIKKGRRCPIKSKMVDTMIFHDVILWTFCAVAEIHRWLALDTASELLLSWLLAWKKPVLTRSWEMAVPYTMALSGWRLYSQDRLLGLEHILRGTAKDHIFCRGSAVLHKWDAGMPGVWCFA